jgi:hypothetical protein
MTIAIERLTALRRILNGEQVPGWEWNSLLLGQNVEAIRQFLQETCEQLGMRVNGDKMQLISKANTIDLTNFGCTTYIVMCAADLNQAATELKRGVREQRDAGGFDGKLAGRRFVNVDNILRLRCDT